MTLDVRVPPRTPTGLENIAPTVMQAVDRRWRAMLVATVAAEHDPSILDAAITTPGADWSGPLRSGSGESLRAPFPLLGSIAPSAIQAQLDAYIATLAQHLTPALEANATGRMLASGDLSIVIVDVSVHDLRPLVDDLANLILGPATGFPSGLGAVTRGVAVRVHDDLGLAAGAWSAAQIGVGMTYVDARLGTSDGSLGRVTWPYRSLTGSSGATASASGSRVVASPLRATMATTTRSVRSIWQDCPAVSACTVHKPPRVTGCLPRRGNTVRIELTAPAKGIDVELQRVRRGLALGSVGQAAATQVGGSSRRWRVALPRHVDAGAVAFDVAYSTGSGYTYLIGLRRHCPRASGPRHRAPSTSSSAPR